MQPLEHIATIIIKALSGSVTPLEGQELERWINASATNRSIWEELNDRHAFMHDMVSLEPGYLSKGREESLQYVKQQIGFNSPRKRVHRVHFLKTAWFRYAAAIIILFGIGAYLFTTQKTKPVPREISAVKDIPAPASNRATITLAGGQKIFLDSVANGILAVEAGTNIQKTGEGNIVYQEKVAGGTMQYNTLTVPRGSRVASIILSDGSKIFLNTASSLKYPVAFNGKERIIEITGEAYFEIAKNKGKPFIVKTPKETIAVLGTTFNVNAYEDEEATKTSLLEGSVKVNDKILLPGQAYYDGKVTPTNMSQDIAWKNGFFSFKGADIPTVMRQLSRWYDIEVSYKGNISGRKFDGEIWRNLTLTEVLKILSIMRINYTIENKNKIIIYP